FSLLSKMRPSLTCLNGNPSLDRVGIGPFVSAYCALRRRNRWREDQKDSFHGDANSHSAQKEKIVDNKKRIRGTLAECFGKKEIGFSIAECHPVDETKKKNFPPPAAQREHVA